MKSARILVVDDDRGQRELLQSFLRGQGYEVRTAASGEAALQLLQEEPFAMMVTDVRMPGLSGLETLRRIRQRGLALPVLLVTAFADIRSAVTAMRDGAVNYLAKPIDLDELLANVRLALNPGSSRPAPAPVTGPDLPPGVIAPSPLMQAVFRDAAVIAPADTRVLITGESGVGKEIVAGVLHRWSSRAAGPLVRVDCAALPEGPLEAELFGSEKGAASGQRSAGRVEEAADGTLFLDEIGELTPPLQAKLLRLIDESTFRRVGSSLDQRTRARIIASTRQDIESLIAAGKFREDLFYRLNVVELHVPPLRERTEDILPLASHFIGLFSRQKPRLSASVASHLTRYRWPGNVRELRNAMERAALLSRGEIVLSEHLPARILSGAAENPPPPEGEAQRLEEIERDAILRTLRKNRYNRTETARELAISRRALTYKLQRLRSLGVDIDGPGETAPPAAG